MSTITLPANVTKGLSAEAIATLQAEMQAHVAQMVAVATAGKGRRGSAYGGFTGNELVTLVHTDFGFAKADQLAVAAKIKASPNGLTIAALASMVPPKSNGKVDPIGDWTMYRLWGGSILVNGMSIQQAYAKAAQVIAAEAASKPASK